jgi:hypothetical protein
MRHAETVFDCPPIWTLYRQDGDSLIQIFGDQRFPGLESILRLTPGQKEGALYFADSAGADAGPFHGPAMELLMINYLAQGRGVITHACGIERGGKGILFVGESGAGKTALARLWGHGGGVDILSDDRVILRNRGGRYWIYGTPWHGEGGFASPRGGGLKAIFFLRQGTENVVEPVKAVNAVSRLLTCSFPPYWDAEGMEFTLGFLEDAVASVPCHELSFVPDSRVIDFVRAFCDETP